MGIDLTSLEMVLIKPFHMYLLSNEQVSPLFLNSSGILRAMPNIVGLSLFLLCPLPILTTHTSARLQRQRRAAEHMQEIPSGKM